MKNKVFFSKNKFVGAVSYLKETDSDNTKLKIKQTITVDGESEAQELEINRDEFNKIKKDPDKTTLSENKEIFIAGKKLKKSPK